MRPQFLLQQHVGTCSRTPKPLPRECSNTALCKTLLDGGTEVGENICLAAATAQTGANIFIWGAEDKSCDAELCYARAGQAPVCMRNPQPLASLWPE